MAQKSTTTVFEIIKRARGHAPQFHQENHPNQALVTFLSERREHLVKALADILKARFDQSRQIATEIAPGVLVGVDENGTPHAATSGDGFAVTIGTDGVPYLGATPIASDPFDGGFPLPDDHIHLVSVQAIVENSGVNTQLTAPVHVVPSDDVGYRVHVGGVLLAFIVDWRLIPLQNPENLDTVWPNVTAVNWVYIAEPQPLTVEGDWRNQVLDPLPNTYASALEWDLVAFLGRRQSSIDPDFKAGLVSFANEEAARALGEAQDGAKKDHRAYRLQQSRRNR